MSQMKENPYGKYFEQINDEFNLMNARLKKLIKNRTALGTENESILREFLKNYIPKHYSVGHGFVFKNDHEISRQCDIIIYDSSFFPPLFKQGDFVVLLPESVMSVIEVKTEIKPGEFLNSSIDNIKSARTLNSRISGLIFAYKGSHPTTILNGLTEYCKTNKIDLKNTFELMVNLDKGYCIMPKRADNGELLYNLDTTVNNIEIEFVFNPSITRKKSFYLFFYYIMRQIRSYIYNTFIGKLQKSPFESDFSFIPGLPAGGLTFKDYFDEYKDEINKLLGKPKYDNNGNLIGVSIK